MKILYVTLGLPYPPDAGPRLRDFHIIREASREAEIYVYSLLVPGDDPHQAEELKQYCRELHWFDPQYSSIVDRARATLNSMRARRPIATWPFYFAEAATKIASLIVNKNIDIVQLEHSFLACYVDSIPTNGVRTVLSFHNIGERQYQRIARLKHNVARKTIFGVKAMLMRDWEAKVAARFDHSIFVSEEERSLLVRRNPLIRGSAVPQGVDTKKLNELPKATTGNELLFVGVLGYPPNADAVLHFCNSILPRVQEKIPDVRLTVVGGGAPIEVKRLAERGNITIAGYVKDVMPYYAQSKVTIVPLRAGGGTRLKIPESMALGRAIVSTSIGCEGLGLHHEKELLIADSPEQFAVGVVRLLEDSELRNQLIANAREFAETHSDWSVIGQKLRDVYRSLGVNSTPVSGTAEPKDSQVGVCACL